MKKKLEADLISIAHRILKLKNKSDLVQLHQETQKLYEKLSVLRFVEEHLGDVKPTIGQTAIEEKIMAAFEAVSEEIKTEDTIEAVAPSVIEEPQKESKTPKAKSEKAPEAIEPTAPETPEIPEESTTENEAPEIPEIEEEKIESPAAEMEENGTAEEAETEEKQAVEFDQPAELAGEMPQQEEAEAAETPEPEKQEEPIKAEDSPFKPAFELSFDAPEEPAKKEVKEDAKNEFKPENSQITFEDIMGSHYADPVFVKAEDLDKERAAAPTPDNVIPIGRNITDSPVISMHKDDQKSYSLNERLSKGITIGLNDRVAFMKHLFNNSSEDYNRVLSQLITFDTFDEAKSFIDNMVKPDYNNWNDKDEYAERFMEIVEKKFS